MFLHSGAGLHGHEYSSRHAGNGVPQAMQPRRSPLLRSAFAPPKTRVASATHSMRPSLSPQQRHGRSFSEALPRTPEPVVRFIEPTSEPETRSVETIEEHPSESELSDVPSQSTDSRRRRRKRRAPKTSTNYALGYPTPKKLAHSKMIQKVLPRLLLQLQICENGWPRPVMEVFPASRVAGPVIAPRLAKKFPKMLSARRQLARDDLVLIQRDDRTIEPSQMESDEEKDTLGDDRLLAVYSPLKNSDNTEIVLEDGSVWVATPLPSGSFDFVHVDASGKTTTVRWAKRQPATATTALSTPTSETNSPIDLQAQQSQSRYTFSIINPLSRRHPVMATLTESTLDVQDSYMSVSSSYGRYPPTRSAGRTMSMTSTGSADEGEHEITSPGPEPERTSHVVDDATKTLIAVTALWVVLRSGWSPCYTPLASSPEPASPTVKRSSLRKSWNGRSEDLLPPLPASESNESTPPALLKRFSAPIQRQRSQSLSPEPLSPIPAGAPVGAPQRIVPRRATSTGAAYMQRRIRQAEAHASQPFNQTPAQNQAQSPSQVQAQPDKEEVSLSSGEESGSGSGGRSKCPRQKTGEKHVLLHQTKSPDVLASVHIAKTAAFDAASGETEATRVDEKCPGKSFRERLNRWFHRLR
ncbi:hypothetical protein GQ53DRAFT_27690 [Thozetella sp. PMI_491]|nr:hypothetical protein GQ53DRAFT_27690 [Thozetella sp. PMI_491]